MVLASSGFHMKKGAGNRIMIVSALFCFEFISYRCRSSIY